LREVCNIQQEINMNANIRFTVDEAKSQE
jgi:hypothetical protein